MHVRCRLRTIREQLPRKDDGGRVSLRDIAERSEVSTGILSQIERGVYLPPDRQIAALEHAYQASVVDWYPPQVLLALTSDEEPS